MTLDEYQNALEKLNGKEFEDFRKRLGGGTNTIEARVREFAGNPVHEQLICYLLNTMYNLGLKTEDEKNTGANVKNAEASNRSAHAAELSAQSAADSAKHATDAQKYVRWLLIVSVLSMLAAWTASIWTIYISKS